jgi:site-specific recombinase XerD
MNTQDHPFQSVLAASITGFLSYKRALGRRFHVEEATLRLLDRFVDEQHIPSLAEISPETIDAFLKSRPRPRPRSYNHLLGTVRRLFDWLVLQGTVNSSPVRAVSKRNTDPRIPFLFDKGTAERLLCLAGSLKSNPNAPFRGVTYRTIFALLYSLGLRVGEVARLCVGDVDWQRKLLVIRQTKFYKSRLVPFGPRLGASLRDYLQTRHPGFESMAVDTPVFTFARNRPINPMTISLVFHALVPRLGLAVPHGVASPRLHDLRHSFAVGTLLRWYRAGIEPQSRLLQLSTFLGHVGPETTAVYLTITDQLLQEANGRFEQFASPAIQGGTP